MNKWRLFLIALLGMVALSVSATPKEKTAKEEKVPKVKKKTIKAEKPKTVYMYGMSINFNDSVVYITSVQRLDSVIIDEEGALQNQAGYTMQLKVYLEGTLNKVNQTCAVIYSDKKKKLEKRYLKARKKLVADKDKMLHQISVNDFSFKQQ